MKKRKLGVLDFEVSELAFGGASVSSEGKGYSFGYISEEDAVALLKEAHQRGINLFDTAPIYGHGVSEIRMGKAFRNIREEVFIVSKSGVTWDENKKIIRTNDPEVVRQMLEKSLKDLQTDYIDLYMIHWPDENIDIRTPLEVLIKARDQGKIRHIGLCNTHTDDLEKAQEVTTVVAVQNQFSLFSPGVCDNLFPYLRQHEIGFIGWGTLDRGIITGRVTKDRTYGKYDARRGAPWWQKDVVERKIQAIEKIKPILDGHSGLELALGFVLRHPEVSTVLCGVRNQDQLDSLLRARGNVPEDTILDQAEEIARQHLQQ